MAKDILAHYGCGPLQFSGAHDGLYERHLLFDEAIDPRDASHRDRYEAFARAVRDVLAQRWVATHAAPHAWNAANMTSVSDALLKTVPPLARTALSSK